MGIQYFSKWAPRPSQLNSLAKMVLASDLQYVRRGCNAGWPMFTISHKTIRYFSLAEILVMAAINQVEAKRKLARK